MVHGFRSSQNRKEKRSNEYSFNHVDRVRIDRNTTYSKDCPNRGSGWRQKPISQSDLISPVSLKSNYPKSHSGQSLDWNNNGEFNDFLSQIEPEKDYDCYYSETYANNKKRAEYYNHFDVGNESCSLRRTRSLAVIREETFNDLQINPHSIRRSQLIPRAKLVNHSFFRKRIHQKQRREEDSAGSGFDTQTSETRESDDYYENLKRLDSIKVSPWQNDKSDLESLNSDYFKNSAHQTNIPEAVIKSHRYQQNKDKSFKTGNNRFQVLDIEIHQDNSQSSAFPETTPSNSEQSDNSSEQLEEEQNPKDTNLNCSKQIEEIEEIQLESVLELNVNEINTDTLTLNRDNEKQSPFIAYDSLYLSSEESPEGTIIEDSFGDQLNESFSTIHTDCSTSLLQISIEDNFEQEEDVCRDQNIVEESEHIHSAVEKSIPDENIKPKILSVEGKLRTLSDYAKSKKRGVLEHLTYNISTTQVVKGNDVTLIDTILPNINENQYYSLPDVNIGQSLKASERIDAKLRSIYNINQLEKFDRILEGNQTAICDSINKFGKAHKKVRQREYSEIDTLIKVNVPKEDENKDEELEQPREAPTIEVKAPCKEKEVIIKELSLNSFSASDEFDKTVSFDGNDDDDELPPYSSLKKTIKKNCLDQTQSGTSDFQLNHTTNNFPGQFKIIVTDIQDNIIEEDSIENKNLSKEHNTLSSAYQVHNKELKNIKVPVDIKKNSIEEIDILNSSNNVVDMKKISCDKLKDIHGEKVDIKQCIKTGNIFKAHPVTTYSNDPIKISDINMSRPQILHVIDSKRCTNKIESVTQNDDVEKEFLEKVDSMRCYWSKLVDDVKDERQNCKSNNRDLLTRTVNETSDIVQNSLAQSIYENDGNLQSFSPTVEIVELDGKKQATIVNAHNAENSEFDHVRYKVIKSNLFKNNLLTRSKKEAQFDGLLQYLQDYSFQELLTNNNVVIIEPVRTKIEKPSVGEAKPHPVHCKITGGSSIDPKAATKRHFFYHPVRVNRELLEDELPTPDTVRNVRKFFEESIIHKKTQPKAQKSTDNNSMSGHKRRSLRYLTIDTSFGGLRKWDSASLSSGISSGDLSSPCECNESESSSRHPVNTKAQNGQQEEIYSSEENLCDDELCESYYVSEDVLEKIRECGSTVTYYGGRVVDNKSPELSAVAKTVIDEIRAKDTQQCRVCQPNNCPHLEEIKQKFMNNGLGIKFKLIKSNSCSSRLELVGTEKNQENGIPKNHTTRQIRTPSPVIEPEESVRELVNRLESGVVNKTPIPRIIESQCIEKTYKNGPNTNQSQLQNSPVTINNHLMGDTVGVTDLIKQVTVNNHITFCQPLSTRNGKGSTAERIYNEMDTNSITSMQMDSQNSIGKVCRNKNVDLDLNMTKNVPEKIKSILKESERTFRCTHTDVSDNEKIISKNILREHSINPQGPPMSEQRDMVFPLSHAPIIKSDTPKEYNKNDKEMSIFDDKFNGVTNKIENKKSHPEAPQSNLITIFKLSDQEEKNETISDEKDSLKENVKNHLQNEEKTTCTQRSSKTESLMADKFFVKHYVANDKNLFQGRKYDDIEFEEFEVYDPYTVCPDTRKDNIEVKGNSLEECYDSLDGKV